MSTGHRSFLGIPVEGNVVATKTRAAQKPIEDLEPLIRALLDDPEIHDFGWVQCTPYFNDGEPCVFGADSVWVRTKADLTPGEKPDEDDDEEEGLSERFSVAYGHPTLGEVDWGWDHSTRPAVRFRKGYEGPDEARFMRSFRLSEAIENGNFDDVLLEAFGDHAEIQVTRDGITIGYYSHD